LLYFVQSGTIYDSTVTRDLLVSFIALRAPLHQYHPATLSTLSPCSPQKNGKSKSRHGNRAKGWTASLESLWMLVRMSKDREKTRDFYSVPHHISSPPVDIIRVILVLFEFFVLCYPKWSPTPDCAASRSCFYILLSFELGHVQGIVLLTDLLVFQEPSIATFCPDVLIILPFELLAVLVHLPPHFFEIHLFINFSTRFSTTSVQSNS
jgi:hypothetical protein